MDEEALYAEAEERYRNRDFVAAEALFRRLAKEFNSGSSRAHARAFYGLGLALVALGRDSEAATEFKEALRLDPELERANQRLREIKDRESAGKPPKPPLTVEPSSRAIYGVVSGLRFRTESDEMTRRQMALMSFRLNRLDVPVGSVPPLPVQFRAPHIAGTLQDGDWAQCPETWQPGTKLPWILNLVTGERISPGRRPLNIARTARITITVLVIIWIAVLFIVVGIELVPRILDQIFD